MGELIKKYTGRFQAHWVEIKVFDGVTFLSKNPIGFLDLGDMNLDHLFCFGAKNHCGVILGY